MSEVVIHHNPDCSKSRAVLALIREAGVEPTVVEYLQTGWTEADLGALLVRMKAAPADVLRARDGLALELGLTEPGVSDAAILSAMAARPELVERPIVETPKGAALCRPPERVLALL
jgi:arsenate reductase